MIKLIQFIIFFFLVLFLATSHGEELKVVVILKTSNLVYYNQAADSFYNRMEQKAKISKYILDEMEETELIENIYNDDPDLIFTAGTAATRALLPKFKEIPIVFSMVINPVHLKFVASFRGSGNNLAGTALDIPLEEQFKWMKRVMPQIKRVGVIWQAEYSEGLIKAATPIASKKGIELIAKRINGIEEIIHGLETLSKKVDLLWAIPDPGVYNRRTIREILLFTLRNKMPFMGASEQYVKAGALFCLSAKYEEQGKQAAAIALRILNGENPSDIPVHQPRDIRLGVNLNTSKLLGLKIPREFLKTAVKY